MGFGRKNRRGSVEASPCAIQNLSQRRLPVIDSLPEWSKGVDSSSTIARCVGSNPTAVILVLCWCVRGGARKVAGPTRCFVMFYARDKAPPTRHVGLRLGQRASNSSELEAPQQLKMWASCSLARPQNKNVARPRQSFRANAGRGVDRLGFD